MKADTTYYGLSLEYYRSGESNITFCVQGTADYSENYYDVEVGAYEDKNGNVIVDGTDANGYEYGNLVRNVIKELSHYKSLIF
jgi:hypothetical protein